MWWNKHFRSISPQPKDSSSPSEWHSIRLSRSLWRWPRQLSGCKLRPHKSWSWVNWCSRSFPSASTLPLPALLLLPAERTHCYPLNASQMLDMSRMCHSIFFKSSKLAAKMWWWCKVGNALFSHRAPQETAEKCVLKNLMHLNSRHIWMDTLHHGKWVGDWYSPKEWR